MAFLAPKDSKAKVSDAAPAPDRTDQATAALAEEQRKRFSSTGGGRKATTYTGGLGVQEKLSYATSLLG